MSSNNTPPPPGTLPFHMTGNFAPVSEELSFFDLPVSGSLPADLCGTYVRNGPNPRHEPSPMWFLGQGMLHGIRLQDGKAVWYRNRWIDGPRTANTSIIRHAGKLLALVETALPVAVDHQLVTLGATDMHGALTRGMTAHPKTCPVTGELLFFAYSLEAPYLTYYRADADGAVVQQEAIAVAAPTYMHDFAITARHVLFFDLPVLFHGWRTARPVEWSEHYGARVGVMPRDGGNADVRWFDIASCFISHTVNACEDDASIVLDVCRGAGPAGPTSLHRYVFDLASGAASEQTMDSRFVDLPRIDERRTGLPYRTMYGLEMLNVQYGAPSDVRLHKFDMRTGSSQMHELGPGRVAGECVFIPRHGGVGEDDGYAMSLVYDRASQTSALLVLDASNFSAPPLASVALPVRVPYGIHGNWFADPAA